MKLQSHILLKCTTGTFISLTGDAGELSVFEIVLIHTNCTEMSFHEAVKGHIISCFYAVFHYVVGARQEHEILAHYTQMYTNTKH